MGTNLQGYHLLWPDLPTFSQLQFTAPLYQGRRLAGFSIIQSTTNRMKPGEKEVNTLLLRNEASCLFFFKPQSALARRY